MSQFGESSFLTYTLLCENVKAAHFRRVAKIFSRNSVRRTILQSKHSELSIQTRPIFVFFSDLAFKKKTEQSSTDYNGFSSRAVDENYSIYYSQKTCTHTKKEMNPWWRVDLGREYIVTGVCSNSKGLPVPS